MLNKPLVDNYCKIETLNEYKKRVFYKFLYVFILTSFIVFAFFFRESELPFERKIQIEL